MNISKADALAFLAKWFSSKTSVQVSYKTVTGNMLLSGEIAELSSSAIKFAGTGSEMVLFFRDTSQYDYKDVREAATEANKARANKYPAFIEIKFANGDRVEISEFFPL